MMEHRSFDENVKMGILVEEIFVKSLQKLKVITDNYEIEHLYLSGRGSGFMFDVLLYCNNGKYRNLAIDVKSVGGNLPPRVFISTRGMNFNKQVRNAISQGYVPLIAFPKYDINGRMALYPSNWFIYRLTYYSWLNQINSYPSYNKMVKKSIKLGKLGNLITKSYLKT